MKQFFVFCLVLFGFVACSSRPATEEYQSDQDVAREKYKFDMIYFDWRGVYLVKLQGHEYLRSGDFILHTASCPGRHGLHGE